METVSAENLLETFCYKCGATKKLQKWVQKKDFIKREK